ncbi:MAG: DivIVA domain-containing protein [Actinomycetota bacterium]|nr:DivIVA domain-containing protein [Actinomycetota bacterium]
MAVSPGEIADREFFTSTDGYDKEEVKSFLLMIAREHQALIERLRSVDETDFTEVGETVREVLESASLTARRLREEAESNALDVRSRAEEESKLLREATREATAKLRREAEDYAFEIRAAAERAVREQQSFAADRVGRVLTGESKIREKLYALELSLQGMRANLLHTAEGVYPELSNLNASLPSNGEKSAVPPAPEVIELDPKSDEARSESPEGGRLSNA